LILIKLIYLYGDKDEVYSRITKIIGDYVMTKSADALIAAVSGFTIVECLKPYKLEIESLISDVTIDFNTKDKSQ